jgi:hypothetical protein
LPFLPAQACNVQTLRALQVVTYGVNVFSGRSDHKTSNTDADKEVRQQGMDSLSQHMSPDTGPASPRAAKRNVVQAAADQASVTARETQTTAGGRVRAAASDGVVPRAWTAGLDERSSTSTSTGDGEIEGGPAPIPSLGDEGRSQAEDDALRLSVSERRWLRARQARRAHDASSQAAAVQGSSASGAENGLAD